MIDSRAQVMENDFTEFREARAREFYQRQLDRSGRLARRGATGAAYTIPLLSGALYYFASCCAGDWGKLGAWGVAEVAVLVAAVPVGAAMSYWLYVAGFKVHEYKVLPQAGHWYSDVFPSFEAAKEEFIAHLLQNAEHNRSINTNREESWAAFIVRAGLATALVVVAALLDLVRSVP